VQGLLFASFVAFWANLAFFLELPPFYMGSSVAGSLGIVGVVGVLAAPLAGRYADKCGKGGGIVALGAAAVAASFAVFWLGRESMAALIGGIVLMDVGVQTSMISNQARVYALDASSRSRLNTVYMTIMFICGALGSAAGAHAFALLGWTGVCALGVACGVLAVAVALWPGAGRAEETC
jgi:predicted MFS family arabinose efflux permease